uniref:Uncharacterized protein n=1 Tax=Populus trichocarpa TaxID=3694 RepID=A0A2K2AXJ2_POPTR
MLYQNREGIFSLKLVCVHSSGSVFRAELKCASGLNLNESRDPCYIDFWQRRHPFAPFNSSKRAHEL